MKNGQRMCDWCYSHPINTDFYDWVSIEKKYQDGHRHGYEYTQYFCSPKCYFNYLSHKQDFISHGFYDNHNQEWTDYTSYDSDLI